MDGILAVTYRCNSRCTMCYTWKYPSDKSKEIRAEDLTTLPSLVRLNVTGGEPFLKEDLGEILSVVKQKAKRVVISTNGFLTKRITEVMSEHRDVGIRISVDGIDGMHDQIRGVGRAHQRALATLEALKQLGIKDLGIAVTVSQENAAHLVDVYKLARRYRVELATAILHNAYYFHKTDNAIENKPYVEGHIKGLIDEYLKSDEVKDWFRAYFTNGIIEHMNGGKRELKCTMARESFFIDPYGNIRPCNVMDYPFGNVNEKPFQEIWASPAAESAREKVDGCQANCWMIGSVGHLMRKKFWVPLFWIARNKLLHV